jgi:hypothetical protein
MFAIKPKQTPRSRSFYQQQTCFLWLEKADRWLPASTQQQPVSTSVGRAAIGAIVGIRPKPYRALGEYVGSAIKPKQTHRSRSFYQQKQLLWVERTNR